MDTPSRFTYPSFAGISVILLCEYACKLNKALHGMRKATKRCYTKLHIHLLDIDSSDPIVIHAYIIVITFI